MRRPGPTLGVGARTAVLAGSHVLLMVVLHALLEAYDPQPNGFRFDTAPKAASIAASFAPPAIVAALAVRTRTVLVLAAIHAASPLLLLGNLGDPGSDLNFAVLLWWFPLPVLLGGLALADRRRASA